MPATGTISAARSPRTVKLSRLVDGIWAVIMVMLLATSMYTIKPQSLCAYMGTDYRGYYTSARIALEHGFDRVYDQALQQVFQTGLYHPCGLHSLPPMERVSMPYLPVFVLIFMPLSAFGFTSGYLLWVSANLLILVLYLLRFSRALSVHPATFRMLQWVICLPVIANLYLGQMNVFLLVCLGEFCLALLNEKPFRSGLWLSGMLIKPHTLLLLLPGLLVSRRWGELRGFLAGALMVAGGSIALAGLDGVRGSLKLAAEFAGPLIRTAPTMMNWRAVALNLSLFIPPWLAWLAAVFGMGLIAALILYLWLRCSQVGESEAVVLLILATYAGTLTIAWHSHFYLLTALIPLLHYLDGKGVLPLHVRAAWLLGPPLWYMLSYLVDPVSVRNWFGLGMLALSFYLLAWAAYRLLMSPKVDGRVIS